MKFQKKPTTKKEEECWDKELGDVISPELIQIKIVTVQILDEIERQKVDNFRVARGQFEVDVLFGQSRTFRRAMLAIRETLIYSNAAQILQSEGQLFGIVILDFGLDIVEPRVNECRSRFCLARVIGATHVTYQTVQIGHEECVHIQAELARIYIREKDHLGQMTHLDEQLD